MLIEIFEGFWLPADFVIGIYVSAEKDSATDCIYIVEVETAGKTFSIGKFESKAEACSWVREAVQRLNAYRG